MIDELQDKLLALIRYIPIFPSFPDFTDLIEFAEMIDFVPLSDWMAFSSSIKTNTQILMNFLNKHESLEQLRAKLSPSPIVRVMIVFLTCPTHSRRCSTAPENRLPDCHELLLRYVEGIKAGEQLIHLAESRLCCRPAEHAECSIGFRHLQLLSNDDKYDESPTERARAPYAMHRSKILGWSSAGDSILRKAIWSHAVK
jgi:hypothetical protein